MGINQLQLPTYATPQQLDFSPLANLGKIYQASQADQIKKQTLAQLGQGGKVDGVALTQAGLQLGDMSLASLGTQLQNTEYSHTRDEKNDVHQAARDAAADRHQSVMEGLAKRTADRQDEDKFAPVKEESADGTINYKAFNPRTGTFQAVPGGQVAAAAPNNPFATGKFNGDQGKASGFTDRMLQSEAVMSGVAPAPGEQGPVQPGIQQQGTNWIQRDLHQSPFGISNNFISADQQKFNQARDNFINAQLRRESGAAIGRDEYRNADVQYFPQPGDTQDVIKQKAANRRSAIEAMGREGGPSYKPKLAYDQNGTIAPYGQPASQPQQPAVPKIGQLERGYRYKGGDPAEPNSWVKSQ